MGVLFVASLFITRLNREWHVDALLERAGKGGPIVAGAAFAIAWTPCIGPTLGAILSAAALSGSAARGALLLAVYSAGLAIPFILTALAFSRMTTAFAVVKRHYQAIVAVGGVILIAMGILIWTGELTQLNIEAQNWLAELGLRLLELGLSDASARCPRYSGVNLRTRRQFWTGATVSSSWPTASVISRPLVLEVAGADDAEAAGADLAVGDHRQAADRVPAQPLDLERVHPHLGRRERAVRVVLVDRLGDRLQVLRLGGCHVGSLKGRSRPAFGPATLPQTDADAATSRRATASAGHRDPDPGS